MLSNGIFSVDTIVIWLKHLVAIVDHRADLFLNFRRLLTLSLWFLCCQSLLDHFILVSHDRIFIPFNLIQNFQQFESLLMVIQRNQEV
jgi:hypothetical protein